MGNGPVCAPPDVQVNTKSALYGMQVAVPYFLERKQGTLINVSSLLGRVAYVPWRSAYCASKHALNALTTACRLEVQPHTGPEAGKQQGCVS